MSEEEVEKVRRRGKRVSSDLIEIVGKFPRRTTDDSDDDISKILNDQLKILAKEAKTKMLKKFILEQEKEISELDNILKRKKGQEERAIAINTPSNHIDIDLRIATELAKLPEEQRKKVIQTYAMLRAAEREAASPNVLLPLLISFSKEHKESSTNEMYQWGKLQLETMKTAWDMAQTNKPVRQGGDDITKTYLELFKEILAQDRELRNKEFEMLLKKFEETRQPGLLDSILLNPDVKNTLREIGLFNPPSRGMDPRIQIELEKLKMEHQKELKRMELEFQMKLQELENERQRMYMMMQGLRQIGGAAAAALGEEFLSENPQNQVEKKTEEEIVTVKCPKCGADITFPKSTEVVTCPKCGSRYKVSRE